MIGPVGLGGELVVALLDVLELTTLLDEVKDIEMALDV